MHLRPKTVCRFLSGASRHCPRAGGRGSGQVRLAEALLILAHTRERQPGEPVLRGGGGA